MLERSCPRLLISAPSKSSGKTTFTLGLARALSEMGHQVHCFKKGPDFIDPLWHKLASGRDSHNLDSWLMSAEVLSDSLERHSRGASISLIEGNHGFHDGLDPDGSNSSAGLAAYLGAPVLLVVDVTGLNRAAGALVLGQVRMPPHPIIAGVVLNRVKSERQAEKARKAIERFAGVQVLGALPEAPQAAIEERHLGLTTTGETQGATERIQAAAEWVKQHLDLKEIVQKATAAPRLKYPGLPVTEPWMGRKRRVAVLRSPAFCFYYPENLAALEAAGAELVFVDPAQERGFPTVEGLYIGGGFPETQLAELSANQAFRRELRLALEAGLTYWAECGGLIYLSRAATWQGQRHELVGWLEGEVEFSQRPVGYGYMELEPQDHWLKHPFRAHEFHYSTFLGEAPQGHAFAVHRGTGLGEAQDGLIKGHGVAGYAHVHALATPDWAPGFMDQVRKNSLE